jgi:hypothetical protein
MKALLIRKGRRIILLLGMVLFGLAHAIGDAREDGQLLAECVLSYQFHSGPSAPQFLSEYVVRVEPSRSVSLWYRFGPGSPPSGVTRKFRLTPQQYQTLIDALAGAGVLGAWKNSNAVPTGADQETVTIAEPSGKTVEISSVLERESQAKFRVVVDAIRAAVPAAAWTAKDRDQRTYQTTMR